MYHRRHGTLPPLPTPEERFWPKVEKTESCWNWTAGLDAYGYGVTWVDGKATKAHRYAWELCNGPIPEGKQLDHRCFNRACVNPAHLRITSSKQNVENHRGARATSRTGVRGVYLSKKSGKYNAAVCHNNTRYWLGQFDSLAEAEAVVIAKRNELFTHNDVDRKAS
jgi:hypothetical protein